LELQGILYLF